MYVYVTRVLGDYWVGDALNRGQRFQLGGEMVLCEELPTDYIAKSKPEEALQKTAVLQRYAFTIILHIFLFCC